MLAKSQPNLLDIGNDNDSDIYDGSNSLKSGTSTNTLNEDEIEREHKGKHKVKDIFHRIEDNRIDLCRSNYIYIYLYMCVCFINNAIFINDTILLLYMQPNPRRRSTLIAQWENLIAANKESIENNNENDSYF